MVWKNKYTIPSMKYTCGYCHSLVAVVTGYENNVSSDMKIRICSHCENPTFFSNKHGQIPGAPFGITIQNLPSNVEIIYDEARRCMAVSAYTSVVMLCRKLLMHIAVEKGADEDESFMYYVDWLESSGFIPPNGKAWVDYIRTKGNAANHEIEIIELQDAEKLITFIGMLMKFVYEFPSMIPDQEDTDSGK